MKSMIFLNHLLRRKIESADSDDWLEDVVCVEESLDVGSAAEHDIERYLGCQIEAVDHNLTVLEWWKKNSLISMLAKKFLVIPYLLCHLRGYMYLVLEDKLFLRKGADSAIAMWTYSFF